MTNGGWIWPGSRILVCEDNLMMAEVVCDFLRDCGLEPIGPAGTLELGLQLAQAAELEGAVLDISLHGRACWPICQALRARGIPFMFLTAYDERAIPGAFERSPAIRKPFASHELEEALSAMLGEGASRSVH